MCYSFSFDRLDDRPRLLSEDLSVRAEGLVKRRLAAYDAADTEDSQNLKPVNRWRALRNLAGREADLDLTVARRYPRPAGLLEAVLERHGRLRGRREKVLSRAPRK